LNLGLVLGRAGHRDDALRHLRRYLELAPDSPRAPQVRDLLAELEKKPRPRR
jgi:regulator of sirC expression with transglutaminase-like and TPR domain